MSTSLKQRYSWKFVAVSPQPHHLTTHRLFLKSFEGLSGTHAARTGTAKPCLLVGGCWVKGGIPGWDVLDVLNRNQVR